MNSSYNAENYECPYKAVADFLVYQVCAILSGLGIVTNTYCIVVFALIIYHKKPVGNMFKFLLAKAVHDNIQFFSQAFATLYPCTTCSTYGTYSMQVWFIYFFYYMESINEFCSGWLELAATFDRLIVIYNILPFCKTNLYFIIVNVVLILYGCGFYSHYIASIRIVEKQAIVNTTLSNGTIVATQSSYFTYEFTDFFFSNVERGFQLMETLGRDAIVIFFLIIFNIIIMIKFQQTMTKKKIRAQAAYLNPVVLSNGSGSAETNNASTPSKLRAKTPKSKLIETVQSAERNHTIMVILTGVIYIVGHSTYFFVQAILYNANSEYNDCLVKLTVTIFFFSYVIPFFVYAGVNKVFRAYAFGWMFRK